MAFYFFIFFPRYVKVVEVANGDYGAIVQQLTLACESTKYNLEKEESFDIANYTKGNEDITIPKIQTPATNEQPLLKNHDDYVDVDGIYMHHVPSEWSKFCTLVNRCFIHYFRDWVNTY